MHQGLVGKGLPQRRRRSSNPGQVRIRPVVDRSRAQRHDRHPFIQQPHRLDQPPPFGKIRIQVDQDQGAAYGL